MSGRDVTLADHSFRGQYDYSSKERVSQEFVLICLLYPIAEASDERVCFRTSYRAFLSASLAVDLVGIEANTSIEDPGDVVPLRVAEFRGQKSRQEGAIVIETSLEPPG